LDPDPISRKIVFEMDCSLIKRVGYIEDKQRHGSIDGHNLLEISRGRLIERHIERRIKRGEMTILNAPLILNLDQQMRQERRKRNIIS
jgi:hypothetical protein